jgi:hypothetical protein
LGIVTTTYKGKPLTLRYFNEHPEIHPLYPPSEVFINKLYIPLLDKAQETNIEQRLEITEDWVKVNGEIVDWR